MALPKSMNTCWENRPLWFCASTALGHCAMVLQVFPAVLAMTACASPSVHIAFWPVTSSPAKAQQVL